MVSVSKSRRKNGEKPKLRRRRKSGHISRSSIIKLILVVGAALLIAYLVVFKSFVSSVDSVNPTFRILSTTSKEKSSRDDKWNGQHFPVVIVGAGIAGLTAAKTLQEHGTPAILLEATSQWGGRIRSTRKRSITNHKHALMEDYFYPIDMGASFIHDPKWLPIIAGDTTRKQHWDWTTTPASEEWKNRSTTAHDMFRQYSWYEFVQDHLVLALDSKIRYNCVVDKIERNPSGEGMKNTMKVSCGSSFFVTADAVIVTIPLPLLQEPIDVKIKQQEAEDHRDPHIAGAAAEEEDDDNDKIHGRPPLQDDIYDDDMDGGDKFRTGGVQFVPPLPPNIQNRIHNHKAKMLPALKIVFEFQNKFYPDYIDIMKQAEMMKDDDDQVMEDPPDIGVNPQTVYEYWADSEVRYDPKVQRPKGAKHYLVGQLLGDPAFAYWNAFFGPFRQNDYYRKSEFQDDMAKHLLQELINYLEPVEGFDEFLVHQNYIGYQMVHWTKETFTPGILDCSSVKYSKKDKSHQHNQVGSVPSAHNQLYFAGEAFANLPRSRYHGCGQAHGAAISGKQAALQILQHFKQGNNDKDSSSSLHSIPVPTDDGSLVHRDLERFHIVRPEDAADLEFYAEIEYLWPDPKDKKK